MLGRKRITQQEFERRCVEKHGDKYDYSNSAYLGSFSKVKIFCKKHAIFFEQFASGHMSGRSGCTKCKAENSSELQRTPLQEFIRKAIKIHGDIYDYSLVNYNSVGDKIQIRCKKHDIFFEQFASNHLSERKSTGCQKCSSEKMSKKRLYTTEHFIKKAKTVYGNKYNYSEVVYSGINNKVKITCDEHRITFFQTPVIHLAGCLKCSGCISDRGKVRFLNRVAKGIRPSNKKKRRFVDKALEKFGDRFDYSVLDYKGARELGCILCRKHNVLFSQNIASHLRGTLGCPGCVKEETERKRIQLQTNFITRATVIHGGKFDYSKVFYKSNTKDVIIICPVHGEFLQQPVTHLRRRGCSMCSLSVGENKIKTFLDSINMEYIREKTFDGCRIKNPLRFDFYLPCRNMCIEFDGMQHFKPIGMFGGKKYLDNLRVHDEVKNKYCEKFGIRLVRIPYDRIYKAEKLLQKELFTPVVGSRSLIEELR